MSDFFESGAKGALALGNRGPLRFEPNGDLAADILDAYWRCGFYVFEGVITDDEIDEIKTELFELLDRAPTGRDADTDRHGRPAVGVGLERPCFRFAQPLGDPFGGSQANRGRYQIEMNPVEVSADAPSEVLLHITGVMQLMDSVLRLYGHPQLLRVAAAINGPDFTPFTSGVWIKEPGLGAAVAWHQDGTTHWDSPELDPGTHGFNFMSNLFSTNPRSALWVVPGTHAGGRVDLVAMAEESGSDQLKGAVPMLCQPGDVAICNRQVVHGSFPNTSDTMRATVNFGFHRRASVLGHVGWDKEPYTAERIIARSRVVQLGIDARRQRFPDETSYVYQPVAEEAATLQLNEATRESILKNYNVLDIGI